MTKIELEAFSNFTALNMGNAIVTYARNQDKNIAVKIQRLHQTIFLYIADNLPKDKHKWLNRKANVAIHFEESSLDVKNALQNQNMTLHETFALSPKKYLAKGGAIPVFVKNAGLVAIITVSGLSDVEDHQIIIDALKGEFF